MNAASLFTGCGGLDLGLEAAGWRVLWGCESDRACRDVLADRRPGLDVVDDVRAIDAGAPHVDLLAGGFPCQPVSQAGQRRAQADERWLWPEFARCIRLLRPRVVLVENVPGLATAGLSDVLADLAEAAYVGHGFRLRASDVGAPHRRERLFLVARNAADGQQQKREGDGTVAEGLEFAAGPGAAGSGASADTAGSGRRRLSEREDRGGERLEASERGEGIEAARDRIEAAPHADDGRREQHDASERRLSEPRARGVRQQWGEYEPAIRRWERLFRPAPPATSRGGQLMPEFVEWMMGFPDGWTIRSPRSQRLRMLGNAVQVQVAEVVGHVAIGAANA